MFTSKFVLFAISALGAWAQITPTSPDGNTVVQVGSDIAAMWDKDTTGKWTDVEIQLMTGDNFNMVPVATLATGIDGTSTTSLNIPCPDVNPYSKIYFLQFTLGGDVTSATWTTRFTIAGTDGSTVPPSETGTFNNVTVQWGTGALVGSAPTLVTGSGSPSNSTSSNSTTPSSSQGYIIATSTGPIASTVSESVASMTSSMSSAASSMSSAASSASAAAAAKSSGAAIHGTTVGLGAVIVGLAGLVAL